MFLTYKFVKKNVFTVAAFLYWEGWISKVCKESGCWDEPSSVTESMLSSSNTLETMSSCLWCHY